VKRTCTGLLIISIRMAAGMLFIIFFENVSSKRSITVTFVFTRYITRDELRHAMTGYGMGDEATIDEILNDVDTDYVRKIYPHFYTSFICQGTKSSYIRGINFNL